MSALEAGMPILAGGLVAALRSRPPEGDVAELLDRRLVRPVREAVTARDRGVCRFCGFTSAKYQQVALLDGVARSLSRMATACIFCHDCFHLDLVPAHRSGVLLALPEMDQAEVHHLARDIYVARITSGPVADEARRALDHLMRRREGARELLGTDDPALLVERIREAVDRHDGQLAALLRTFDRIRHLPLDRRIVTEVQLQFNQFPQILAFWRSKRGPYAGAADREFPRIARFLGQVAGGHSSRGPGDPGSTEATADEAGSDVRRVGVPPQTVLGLGWRVADPSLRRRLASEVGTVDGALAVRSEDSRILVAQLPYYEGVSLVSINDPGGSNEATLYYLVHLGNEITRLDGTAAPILEMNGRVGVRLRPDTALPYLRFFCFFVRGKEGPFHLLESLDDPLLPDDLPGAARDVLEEAAKPAELVGSDDEGSLVCRGVVWYGTHLFQSDFALRPDGRVEMVEHRPVGSTTDVRLHAP